MNVKFTLRKVEQVQAYLKALPRGTVIVAMNAIAEYILGDARHGLRNTEPYKYVSRAAAYSDVSFTAKDGHQVIGYSSLEQLQAVMAKTHGKKYVRTGEVSAAWTAVDTNNGYGKSFVNDAPGAVWLYSDSKQANQLQMVGHRTVTSKVMSNIAGALRHARAEVSRYLKNKK